MSPLVVNRKLTSKYDVYVGRPTKWGNPFREGVDGTRREVITKYAAYVLQHDALCRALPELRGKMLACSCRPKECHADVLATLANSTTEGWRARSGWEPSWWCDVGRGVADSWFMHVYSNGEWVSGPGGRNAPVASVELGKYLAVERWVSRYVFKEL